MFLLNFFVARENIDGKVKRKKTLIASHTKQLGYRSESRAARTERSPPNSSKSSSLVINLRLLGTHLGFSSFLVRYVHVWSPVVESDSYVSRLRLEHLTST